MAAPPPVVRQGGEVGHRGVRVPGQRLAVRVDREERHAQGLLDEQRVGRFDRDHRGRAARLHGELDALGDEVGDVAGLEREGVGPEVTELRG